MYLVTNRPSSRNEATPPPKVVAHQIAGNIALDFCNTAGEHLASEPDELLVDREAFLRWCMQVGMIGPGTYWRLLRSPFSMNSIIELREAIYRVALAIARNEPVAQKDLHLIEKRANGAKPEIVREAGGLRWKPGLLRGAEQLCSLLASEALSLFCSPRAARIGVCDGGLCGWVFLDDSRGMRRRWCDMNDCGSRAKAKRFYTRRKSEQQESESTE
jgi:predicted RNA-binding Zn ribbon-like protein